MIQGGVVRCDALYVLLNRRVVHDYEMNVCILYVVDLKSSLELVFVILFN